MGPEHTTADHLDDEATRRIARTFLMVRVVRGSLLLVFLVVAVWASLSRDWPGGVVVAIAATAVLQAGRLAANLHRLRTTGSPDFS